jgi:hypothetical protein
MAAHRPTRYCPPENRERVGVEHGTAVDGIEHVDPLAPRATAVPVSA